jgi:DNA polymerase-3 subunit gamma/tau
VNLISQRPDSWNAVVGQPRAITVLQAILNNKHLMLKGFLFYGFIGVGKTTTSYLLARALLCTGKDPLGCGKCDSCLRIVEDGIDSHSDFKEIDAALYSGVDKAREIMELWGTQTPNLSKRRVIVIDEAHRLSSEAWDVFLKPLEQGNFCTSIIFVSNKADSIAGTIRSRCTQIPFELVHLDTVVGLLANVANRNNITYELDALRLIARQTKGIIRDAVNILGSAAALGLVSIEHVKIILDTSLEDVCIKLMRAIAARDQAAAIQLADEAGRKARPAKAIEMMFSIYGRAVFAEADPDILPIYVGLPETGDVTALFIKWATTPNLPSNIMPLVAFELLKLHGSPSERKARQRAQKAQGGALGNTVSTIKELLRIAPPEGVAVEDIPPAKPSEMPNAVITPPQVAAPEEIAAFLSDEPEDVRLDGLVKDMEEVAAKGIPVVEVEDEPIAAERHVFVPSGDADGYEDDPM